MINSRFSISQLINQHQWLEIHIFDRIHNDTCIFRFQVKNLQQLDKSLFSFNETDDLSLIEQGKIMLLELDVINLSKRTKQYGIFISRIFIEDAEGFSFRWFYNEAFRNLEYVKDTSFNFLPKIKTGVTLFYLLPNEESKYYLAEGVDAIFKII